MLRKSTDTRHFRQKAEDGQNPYSGIVSFQHFRGEKLYSDIVVKPENNFCETENVECYPIPDDVPQNGREEGYYPDSTVAYIRILWKEFEPEPEVYNYRFIEDIIEQARAHSQTIIFRLMAHSTRARDDVPDWLKKLISCPERPDGKRVKDSPTDPQFIKLFCRAVRRLGERFDREPILDAIDISLPGSWGEGHNLHLYSEADILSMVDTYVEVFKHTQLMAQSGLAKYLHYVKQRANIGWRADGLGSPKHTKEIYPSQIAQIADFWETAPVSFEAYWWMGEWKRQGWPLDEIIEKTLEWHITTFNPKSIPIPYEWEEKVKAWLSRMGYHYAINSFSYPAFAVPGDTLEMNLAIENIGVAPSYHTIPLYIRLRGDGEYTFKTDVDIKKWMPGKHSESIEITLPETVRSGRYSIEAAIYDEIAKNVYFATDAPRDGYWYMLGQIDVGE